MPQFLISFDEGTMIIPDGELPEVAAAANAVVDAAREAGVWVTGAGVIGEAASIVATDGTVTTGPWPETKATVGGFSILEVASRDEALDWAKRLAVACRCAQEVREIM